MTSLFAGRRMVAGSPAFRRNFAVRQLATKKSFTGGTKSSGGVDDAAKGKRQDATMKKFMKVLTSAPGSHGLDGLTESEDAEFRAAAIEFNAKAKARHMRTQQRKQFRLHLMKEAINELPEEEQEAARTPDRSLQPLHRRVLVDTPPIPGYTRVKKSLLE
jgi:hypothetical protein